MRIALGGVVEQVHGTCVAHGRISVSSWPFALDKAPLRGFSSFWEMPHSKRGASGQLFVSLEGVTLLTRDLYTELHRHFTASLVLCLEGELRVRGDAQAPWHTVPGYAAMPNVTQQLDATGALIVNLQIDPETEAYARLAERLLRDAPLITLADEVCAPLRAQMRTQIAQATPRGRALWDMTLDALGGPPCGNRIFEPRIARALEILKASMPEAPSTRDLGQQVGLSEGRLIHLFSQQVGVPLRRYVLWLRVRHLVFCVAIGKNLTDAAHEAGFADSAHFTRVFRGMFGIAPSQILRSEQIQISLELSQLPLTGPHAVQDAKRLMSVVNELSKANQWSRKLWNAPD